MHREDIIPVDLQARNCVGGPATSHARISCGILKRNLSRKLIIFADKQHGQFPDAGKIQSFVERAIIGGAVPEERDGNEIRLEELEAIPRAGGLKDARPHDSTRSHETDFRSEEMHASTASARAARLPSIQLGNELTRIEAFRECMAMSAVSAENHILTIQMGTDSDCDCFLPHIGVTRAMNKSPLMRSGQPLFGETDQHHLSVEREKLGG